jgi:hypothetical protein
MVVSNLPSTADPNFSYANGAYAPFYWSDSTSSVVPSTLNCGSGSTTHNGTISAGGYAPDGYYWVNNDGLNGFFIISTAKTDGTRKYWALVANS